MCSTLSTALVLQSIGARMAKLVAAQRRRDISAVEGTGSNPGALPSAMDLFQVRTADSRVCALVGDTTKK